MQELNQLRLIAASSGDVLERTINAMIDGVAFPDGMDSKLYRVFSHEGDDICTLSTAEVNFAIFYMKQQGRRVGTMEYDIPSHPGFSFAWQGRHYLDIQRGINANR